MTRLPPRIVRHLRVVLAGASVLAASALTLTACSPARSDAASPTASSGGPTAQSPRPTSSGAGSTSAAGTPIRIVIDGTTVSARLNDSSTARDLAGRLPLTVSVEPYNDHERVARISPELSTAGVPGSADPIPGDLGYYSPDANLVFYNGDVGRYPGIVRIGRIDGPTSAFTGRTQAVDARIERAG